MDDHQWAKMSYDEKVKWLMEQIEERKSHWEDVYENGCNDPLWSDGVNLNLIRNHIIYYLNELSDLKKEPRQMSLLDAVEIDVADHPELDSRVPPIVDTNYMAKERSVVSGSVLR